ncbi:uncharacterized protein LOC141665056 [Apium graveolens]|uniref:uncharacterized protein LOC141665056 n=1 Tax=Apium graveolens TaxID=4045 RepID=UPI003D7B1C46
MRTHVFNRIMTALCTQDSYWHKKEDAVGLLGLLPQQKMTATLRMLAYGTTVDQCAEICRMGESTTLECMKKFCQQVEGLFVEELSKRVGGAYSGRKGRPTIILEVVVSYDPWVWHAFFGVPGAQNDINVLGQSPVFDKVVTGNNPTVKLFAKKHEAYRKDVERFFGILQSRWVVLRHGARMHKRSTLKIIMMTCIILHNMIVDDEFVEDEFIESVEEDLMNPSAT